MIFIRVAYEVKTEYQYGVYSIDTLVDACETGSLESGTIIFIRYLCSHIVFVPDKVYYLAFAIGLYALV